MNQGSKSKVISWLSHLISSDAFEGNLSHISKPMNESRKNKIQVMINKFLSPISLLIKSTHWRQWQAELQRRQELKC